MRMVINAITLAICLIGLSSQAVLAASYDKHENNVKENSCNVLSFEGKSSYYSATDGSIYARLYYNPSQGNSVKGGLGAVIEGNSMWSDLGDSRCDPKTGIVVLKFETSGFKGVVAGMIDSSHHMLRDVSGVINGKRVSADLIFQDYV